MFALTNQEIAARCPQVFETSYSSRRTQKYGQLTTASVIDALRTEGYEVTSAFAQSAKAGKRPTIHHKHCVRLSHRDFLDTLSPDETRPEIVIVNSHDGSSSFRIMAGIFRLVCENGLIIAVATVSLEEGILMSGPEIISRGFVYVRESEELMNGTKDIATRVLIDALDDGVREWNELKTILKNAITKYIFAKTKRKPVILPILLNI